MAIGSAAGAITLSGLFGTAVADADALCDQLRAQYGPGWPCVNVPTYTPPPTLDPPPDSGVGGAPNSGTGPALGGDPGPGPGEGNGTPIIGGPDPTTAPAPTTGPQAPITAQTDTPGQRGSETQEPAPKTLVPAPTQLGRTEAPATTAFNGSSGTDDTDLPFWILAAAAALAVSYPRGRSIFRRGGSTRATIGPTRLVLIHDPSSPNTYRFAMNVPEGGRTVVNPDGSATVYDKDRHAIQQVERPWAYDSAGRPQKTWYEVDDNGDLIQHVEPADNALYPILADPTVGDIDTTGQTEGVGWYDPDMQPGEVIVHKIVEGTGGQSVETTTIRGGTASTTLTVNDTDNGGYQQWSDNSDGESTYVNVDGDGYTETQTFDDGNVYGPPDQVEFTQQSPQAEAAPTDEGDADENALKFQDTMTILDAQRDGAMVGAEGTPLWSEWGRAQQRDAWREQGYSVRMTGETTPDGTPIATIRDPETGNVYEIPQYEMRGRAGTWDLPGRVPGVDGDIVTNGSNPKLDGSTSIEVLGAAGPEGWSGADSPYAVIYGKPIKIDPERPGMTLGGQRPTNLGDGTVSFDMNDPRIGPIPKWNEAPKSAPKGNSGSLDISYDEMIHVRVVGAKPMAYYSNPTSPSGPSVSITYEYQYEMYRYRDLRLNDITSHAPKENWQPVSPDYLDSIGVKYPNPRNPR